MNNTISEYERGARAAIEAFDLYFRNENGGIVAGVHYESDDSGPEFWKPITEDELEGYGKSALADVMYDERVGKCAACSQAIESHNAPGATFYSHVLHPADGHEANPNGEAEMGAEWAEEKPQPRKPVKLIIGYGEDTP